MQETKHGAPPAAQTAKRYPMAEGVRTQAPLGILVVDFRNEFPTLLNQLVSSAAADAGKSVFVGSSTTAAEAKRLLATFNFSTVLISTNQHNGGWDAARELISEIKNHNPDASIIVISGSQRGISAEAAGITFIQKPLGTDELRAALFPDSESHL